MLLTDEQKDAIKKEYESFVDSQYAGKSKEERQELGQFFTPPELTFKMLEKFEDLNGTVLDPTVGAGGLIAAAVIAGADPKKCYGIELDKDILGIARKRLSLLGVPEANVHQGNALYEECYDFSDDYNYEKAVAAAEKRLAAPVLPMTGFSNFFKK